MTDRNETLADVVAEIRANAKTTGMNVHIYWNAVADRIEAAAKRETVTNCNGFGNAAKLREALQMFVDSVEWLCDGDESGRIKRQFAVLLSDAHAALAAPPRNCDRFATEEDANAAFDKMCDLRGDGLRSCIGCKYNGGERGGFPSISRCRVAWLFDTSAQEGGDHADA